MVKKIKNILVPLYVIGMPEDEFNAELIISKLSSSIQRLEMVFHEIEESRLSIKRTRSKGKKQNYIVSVLIKTPKKRFSYKDTGWDLSNVCEKLNQRILSNLTKRSKKRSRLSIRKIEKKLF